MSNVQSPCESESSSPVNVSRWQRLRAHVGAGAQAQRGMTLLEIMIVLAILALVMALLIGPRVMAMFGESKTELAKIEARKLAMEAYPQWSIANPSKSCPADLSELSKYMNKKEINDPWGKPYVMMCGDKAPAGVKGMGVMSMGEDGKANTGDDIKSWD